MSYDIKQGRARFVMSRLRTWTKGTVTKEAVTRCKSLPVQVRSQGITIALAVLLREDRPASVELANILAGWLLGAGEDAFPLAFARNKERADGRTLLSAVVEADRTSYLALQREAIEFLDELKLLADAMYGDA